MYSLVNRWKFNRMNADMQWKAKIIGHEGGIFACASAAYQHDDVTIVVVKMKAEINIRP
jgi:hypothetical protein